MTNEQVPFFAQAVLLDSYIKSANPTTDPAALEIVLDVIRRKADLRNYFFRSRPHPAWAEVLWDNGLLSKAPEPITEKEGIRFPFWEAQEYLISIAENVPEIVAKHLNSIDGHPWYKGRALRAVHSIPPTFVKEVLPTIVGWLSKRDTALSIAEDAHELMVELARKQDPAALEIFRQLSAPYPSSAAREVSGFVMNAEAVSVLPDPKWILQPNKSVRLLSEIDAYEVASILEEQLLEALKIEAATKQSGEYDYRQYSWWRSAIEDTGQDLGDDFKDILLESLRDTLELMATGNHQTLILILKKFSNDPHEILRRLRLHVLSSFPSDFKDDVSLDLLNEPNYDEIGIHHEFFMLLKRGFPVLSKEKQNRVVTIILNGPPQEAVEKFIDWVKEETPTDRDQAIKDYKKRWTLDRLTMIADNLPGSTQSLFNELKADLGESEHPDFTRWTGGAFFVSDVSPLDADQLALMPPGELAAFLGKWEPSPNRTFGPQRVSYRGLANAVASVIHKDPIRYNAYFVVIGLLRPEFAYTLLGELKAGDASVGGGSEESWSLFLDLSEAILSDGPLSSDMNRTTEITWRDARAAIVSGIRVYLKRNDEEKIRVLSRERLIRARNLLIKLANDPDPDLENDRPKSGWFQTYDPATAALNHVRPDALGVLIEHYSVYVAYQTEEGNGIEAKPEGPGPNRLEPEVESVLTNKLNTTEEPSLAIRSVYGRALKTLYWLNQGWVESHIDEIFPTDSELVPTSYFVAAWDSYVVFNLRYTPLFELLHSKYINAIDNLSNGFVSHTHLQPERALAGHVLGSFLYGDLEISSPAGQDSLLALFFRKAPSSARGGAIWLLWKAIEERVNERQRFWLKAKEIWKGRVDVGASANHSSDFDAEMAWFPHLLEFAPETETITSLWPLLEGTLPFLSRARHVFMVWEKLEKFLVREIEREPLRVIQFYRLMHEQVGRPIWHRDQTQRKLLEIGAGRKESRDATLSVIDLIARRGDHSYRDIYDRYAR